MGHDGPELTLNPSGGRHWAKEWVYVSAFNAVMHSESKVAWAQLIEHAASSSSTPSKPNSAETKTSSTFIVSVTTYSLRDVFLGESPSFCTYNLNYQKTLQNFCDDEEVIFKAARCRSKFSLDLSKRLKGDRVFMKQLFAANPIFGKDIAFDFQDEPEFWLECFQLETEEPYFFADCVPLRLLTNEFIRRVINLDKPRILHCSSRNALDFEDDVFLQACRLNYRAFLSATPWQQNTMLSHALQANVFVFKLLSWVLRQEYDNVAVVINKMPSLNDCEAIDLISYICEGSPSNKVLKLIRTYLLACKPNRAVIPPPFARHFSKDDEVLRVCAKNTPDVLEHASYTLLHSRDAFMDILAANGDALQFATRAMQNDTELVLLAIKSSPRSIEHASARLRACEKTVVEAIGHLGLFCTNNPTQQTQERPVQSVLKFVCKHVARQPRIQQLAVDASAWEVLPVQVFASEKLMLQAIKNNAHVFWHLDLKHTSNVENAKAAVSQDKLLYTNVASTLRLHPSILQLL